MVARLLALATHEAGGAVVPGVDVDDVVARMFGEARAGHARVTLIAQHFFDAEVDRTVEEDLRHIPDRHRAEQPTIRGQDVRVEEAAHLLTLLVVLAAEYGVAVLGAEHQGAAAAAERELKTEVPLEERVELLDGPRAQRELLRRLVHHLGLGRDHPLHYPLHEGENRERVRDDLEALGDAPLDLRELAAQVARHELERYQHLEEPRRRNHLDVGVSVRRGEFRDQGRRDLGVLPPEDDDVLGQEGTPDGTTGLAVGAEGDGVVGLVRDGEVFVHRCSPGAAVFLAATTVIT